MKSLPELQNHKELDSLLSKHCEGILDREGELRLARIIGEDSEARRYYLHYLDLHMDLARRAEVSKLVPIFPAPGRAAPSRPFRWTPAITAAAAILILGLTASIFWFPGEKEQTGSDVKTTQADPGNVHVAYVGEAESVDWNRPQKPEPGLELKPGDFELASGKLRLDFFDGTAVTVVGPATFSIADGNQVFLKTGQLAVQTAEVTSGFVVRTPDAVFVDVGTEFSVNVNEEQTSQLLVRKGEVIATLLSPEGATVEEHAASTGQSLQVDVNEGIREAAFEETIFASMLLPAALPLQISDAYVAAIRSANPLAYWRFEELHGKSVTNEMKPSHSALSLGNSGLEGPQSNRAILFNADDQQRGLFTMTPFEGFPAGTNYSIELWMNPQSNRPGALISLIEVEATDLEQAKATAPTYRSTSIECTAVESNHWTRAPEGKIAFVHRNRSDAQKKSWPKGGWPKGGWSKGGWSERGDRKSPDSERDDHRSERHEPSENARRSWEKGKERGEEHHRKDYRKRDDRRDSSPRRNEGYRNHDHTSWSHYKGKRGTESRIYSKSRYTPGRWHHVVAVREHNKISLYVDGRLEGKSDADSSSDLADLRVIIGRYSLASGAFGRPFVGRIDEVAIYNRALSEVEIRRHFELVGEAFVSSGR